MPGSVIVTGDFFASSSVCAHCCLAHGRDSFERMRRSLLCAAIAGMAVLGALSLAGCTPQQSLPHPAPTSAKQTVADFVHAAKAGDYTSLEKITNPGLATRQTSDVAKQMHKAVHTSGCTISGQKIRESGGWWAGTNTVKCAGELKVKDYTVAIAQYTWKIAGAVATSHPPIR
jgi:hypothetical protein